MVVSTMLVLNVYKTPQGGGMSHPDMQVTSIPVIGMIGEDTLIPKNADRSRKTVGDDVWIIKSTFAHLFESQHDLPHDALCLTTSDDVIGCGVYFDSDGMLKLVSREVVQSIARF